MDLAQCTVVVLKNKLSELNLATSGSKNELITRLRQNGVNEIACVSVENNSKSVTTEDEALSVISNEENVVDKLRDDVSVLQRTMETLSQQLQSVLSSSQQDFLSLPSAAPVLTAMQQNSNSTTTTTPNNAIGNNSVRSLQHTQAHINSTPSNATSNLATSQSVLQHAAQLPPYNYFSPRTQPSSQQPMYVANNLQSFNNMQMHLQQPCAAPTLFSYGNVRDIISILPEFNPYGEKSLNSIQFVKRVETLRNAYKWDDATLIFAVQQKMQGPARHWVDSLLIVFQTWQQFVEKFTTDFPCTENIADVHIKMARTKRQNNESPQEFYYKMLAIGAKSEIPECAIARHIVNGINEPDLKKKISNEYVFCHDLLRDINSYCYYNEIKSVSFPKPKFSTSVSVALNSAQDDVKKIENKQTGKNIKCYNCFKFGHFSVNCPEPQKKERCSICQRTSHQTANCAQRNPDAAGSRKAAVNKIQERNADAADLITKQIKVNDNLSYAIIDPGSNRTLVRRTFADKVGQTSTCSIILNGFAGGQYICTTKVAACLEIDGNRYETNLLVVENEHISENILLGKDVLCREGNRCIIEGDDCWIENAANIQTGEHLSSDELAQLKNILNAHRKSFAKDVAELGTCTETKMEIQLTTDSPVHMKPYRIAFGKRPIISNIISELLESNIIRVSESPYASPVVLVEKKNGEHRMCVDFRQLNRITIKTPFPMPIMEEQFAQLAGNSFFSTLDLRMGYHQIEIAESSRKYTSFVTTDGHYEYNRMPFGLVNAPAVFQALMNKLVSRMNPGEVLAYLDDVILPSKTVEEGLDRLKRFIIILERSGLTLRLDKCKFLVTEISHLGHVINKNGISPGKEKVAAIKNFKQPTNVTEVRRFLGLTGFFRKFVQDYSLISKPITNLLRKSNNDSFVWGEMQQQSFSTLIEKLCSEPVLSLYDFKAEHEVHTDASSVGLAGILLQSTDGKTWQPVFYYSRHCTDIESRYHSYELEVLAAVEALERFRVYVLGKRFRLVTDCAAIAKVKEKKELIPKIARWCMKLLEYNCEVVHRSGNRMAHVDSLSRSPDQPANDVEPAGFILKVTADTDDWLLTMQLQDESLLNIIAVLNGQRKSDQLQQLKSEYTLRHHRLFRKEGDGLKFVVPKAVRWRIVRLCHDEMGHFGLEKTIQRIKTRFWFPRMRKYVKQYLSACVNCCYFKSRGGKPEGQLHYDDIEPIPFRMIHIDHLGPFIKSKRGNTYILAITDAFSKFSIIKPTKNTKTVPVINVLNEITSYFGLPQRIVSDRGTAFTSKMFEDFCESNNIIHIKTAVRTPRANGQVERTNQTILSYLRTSNEDPKDWDLLLRELQWTINSQKNSTSGFSPNELVFDFKLTDVIHNHIVFAVHDDVDDRIQDTDATTATKRQQAVTNIMKERAKWKQRFDQKHNKPTEYCENDLVVIENEAPATTQSRKLEPKYRGPYIIKKVLGKDRFLIEDVPGAQVTSRKFSSVYSSDKIKPWCQSPPELDVSCDYDTDDIEDDSTSGTAELSTTP